MLLRVAGNMGSFYPASCGKIGNMIEEFNRIVDGQIEDRSLFDEKPRAIISPHAGYIYSGFTANIAHRLLANGKAERVVVIGPSHHVYFEGVSGSFMDRYETPCGELDIDREYLEKLSSEFPMIFAEDVHRREHSTETQMPFIKYYLPDSSVVELVYGKIDQNDLLELLRIILKDPANSVVISSDLSHFHSLEQAKRFDNICLAGVAKIDPSILKKGCEACGLIGIEAIVRLAHENRWKSVLLDYRTSADASGDRERVVGYMSSMFTE